MPAPAAKSDTRDPAPRPALPHTALPQTALPWTAVVLALLTGLGGLGLVSWVGTHLVI